MVSQVSRDSSRDHSRSKFTPDSPKIRGAGEDAEGFMPRAKIVEYLEAFRETRRDLEYCVGFFRVVETVKGLWTIDRVLESYGPLRVVGTLNRPNRMLETYRRYREGNTNQRPVVGGQARPTTSSRASARAAWRLLSPRNGETTPLVRSVWYATTNWGAPKRHTRSRKTIGRNLKGVCDPSVKNLTDSSTDAAPLSLFLSSSRVRSALLWPDSGVKRVSL